MRRQFGQLRHNRKTLRTFRKPMRCRLRKLRSVQAGLQRRRRPLHPPRRRQLPRGGTVLRPRRQAMRRDLRGRKRVGEQHVHAHLPEQRPQRALLLRSAGLSPDYQDPLLPLQHRDLRHRDNKRGPLRVPARPGRRPVPRTGPHPRRHQHKTSLRPLPESGERGFSAGAGRQCRRCGSRPAAVAGLRGHGPHAFGSSKR